MQGSEPRPLCATARRSELTQSSGQQQDPVVSSSRGLEVQIHPVHALATPGAAGGRRCEGESLVWRLSWPFKRAQPSNHDTEEESSNNPHQMRLHLSPLPSLPPTPTSHSWVKSPHVTLFPAAHSLRLDQQGSETAFDHLSVLL